MVTAILLAAGTSSRMGKPNKMLLLYKDKPLVLHVVETLQAAGVEDIIVVTGFEADKFPTHALQEGIRIVFNPDYASGMTSSIQRGVRDARGTGYMICLADMVTVTASEYRMIIDAFAEQLKIDAACISLPVYNRKKGNPVIFSASYRVPILEHTAPEGCKEIVQQNAVHIHQIIMNSPHILEDVDTPDDYYRILMQ